jgi:GMP synthase-like glutamine amidotransferase
MRALVIGNGDDFDSGYVGHRFRERGYVFVELHRDRPDEWPDDARALAGVDLVLVLGSEWNVYNPELAEFVAVEAALVGDAHRTGVPTFGICYGAQMVAHACGGQVGRTVTPEIGWYKIESDVAEIAAGPWAQWHYDVFTVPDGFTELARSGVGPQAIRAGRTFATQFHPELTETMMVRWLGMGGADHYRAFGGDPAELIAETRANVPASQQAAFDLVDWFCDSVAR